MIKTAEGIVKRIYYSNEKLSKLIVEIDENDCSCINYNCFSGSVTEGDKVLLNTTAVDLRLGTGGFHFVMANLSRPELNQLGEGHIMKLKYTPIQFNCMPAETQESQYHELFKEFQSLNGMPVIIGSLHSILAPCCLTLKNLLPNIRICYIMTDGGALPIHISDVVRKLKQDFKLDSTVTYGSAFGGDYECINIYTALITAKEIIKADVAIVSMGPGIVGTDTKFGFSGAEQAGIADAVNKLGGFAALVPRISFADKRERHVGISHHTLTVLKELCCTRTNVAVPKLDNNEHMELIHEQLSKNGINSLHNLYYVDISDIDQILSNHSEYLHKMGRGYEEEKEYFLSCAATAKLCLQKLS